MFKLEDFSYHLPPELIAQTPAVPRDSSKLLIVDRNSDPQGASATAFSHHHFYELDELLDADTVLVRNDTKVIPARIYGQKTTGGQVEILLTRQLEITASHMTWECLTKPGLKPGQIITFSDSDLVAECTEITGYTRSIKFNQPPAVLFASLEKIGHTPLPPYITWGEDDSPQLKELYQTTYAAQPGSAAAPTAGLHFTPELDQRLLDKGISIETVTLHVGLGTFLPVKTTDITQHHIHQEVYELQAATAYRLNQALLAGKKIIAVGTTTTRVLETCAAWDESAQKYLLSPATGETGIYIYPPYQFKILQGLITNFHLPESTLLMLISAFATAPNTKNEFFSFNNSLLGKAYQHAINHNYRFFSFGDAMLIR